MTVTAYTPAAIVAEIQDDPKHIGYAAIIASVPAIAKEAGRDTVLDHVYSEIPDLTDPAWNPPAEGETFGDADTTKDGAPTTERTGRMLTISKPIVRDATPEEWAASLKEVRAQHLAIAMNTHYDHTEPVPRHALHVSEIVRCFVPSETVQQLGKLKSDLDVLANTDGQVTVTDPATAGMLAALLKDAPETQKAIAAATERTDASRCHELFGSHAHVYAADVEAALDAAGL